MVSQLLEGGGLLADPEDMDLNSAEPVKERTGILWKIGNTAICIFILVVVIIIPLRNFIYLIQIDQFGAPKHHEEHKDGESSHDSEKPASNHEVATMM